MDDDDDDDDDEDDDDEDKDSNTFGITTPPRCEIILPVLVVVLLLVVLGVVVIVLLLSPLKLTPPCSIPIPIPRFRDRCVKERTTIVVKFIVRIIVSAVLPTNSNSAEVYYCLAFMVLSFFVFDASHLLSFFFKLFCGLNVCFKKFEVAIFNLLCYHTQNICLLHNLNL